MDIAIIINLGNYRIENEKFWEILKKQSVRKIRLIIMATDNQWKEWLKYVPSNLFEDFIIERYTSMEEVIQLDDLPEIIYITDAKYKLVPNLLECLKWQFECNENINLCFTKWREKIEGQYQKKEIVIRKRQINTCLSYAMRKSLFLNCVDKYKSNDMQNMDLLERALNEEITIAKLNIIGVEVEVAQENLIKINMNTKIVEYPIVENTEFKKICYNDEIQYKMKKNNKRNILLLIPWMEMGGADLFNLDIVERLDKEKYEVGIISTVPSESIWRERFEKYTNNIFELPGFLHINDWADFISYYINSRSVDVLFLSNSYYGYYLLPWLRMKFPNLIIVDYVHMEEWYYRSGGYARTSGALGDILEKTYVCNEKTRQVLIQEFGRKPETVKTLYIGVDEEKYNPDIEGVGVRKQFGIDKSKIVVLFPCRMHPQKRPYLMLEIANRISKEIEKICFLVVGDGSDLSGMKHFVKKQRLEENVIFAGRQDEMIEFYRSSDMTLICSIREGLSLTAYESLAMGVPVITSDVGGQSELVDNSVGRVVPVLQDEKVDFDTRRFSEQEINLYIKAIKELIKELEEKSDINLRCRMKIEGGFSKALMMQKLEANLEQLWDEKYSIKRRELNNVLNSLPNLIEDYTTIYKEYEIEQGNCNKYRKILNRIRDIVTFKVSSIQVYKEIMSKKDHYVVKKILRKLGI